METKHTPGPWRLAWWDYKSPDRSVLTIQNDRDAIAQVLDLWCMDERGEEKAANARLLAAAPDMLIALQTIALHAPSLDAIGIRELCDAAIARATNP